MQIDITLFGMNILKKTAVAVVASGLVAAGIAYTVPESIDLAGRTNVHSGGHGEKRHGGGGRNNPHANDVTVSSSDDVQLVGRTNVHSNGRAGGKAQSRGGSGRDTRSTGWH